MVDTQMPWAVVQKPPPLDGLTQRTMFQSALGFLIAAVMLSGFICGLRVSPMIDDMSLPLKSLLFAWGILFGAFVLISVPTQPSSQAVKVIITVLSGLSFVADGNAAREAYVFLGGAMQVDQVLAPITGSSHCFGRSQPKINVIPYPGKSLSIKTTLAVCDKYGRHVDGHECVRLKVETGKFGIRRMIDPLSIETC